MKKYQVITTFVLFLCCSVSAQTITNDGKSISIDANEAHFYTTTGTEIRQQQFDDSLASGKYIMSIDNLDDGIAHFSLLNKTPNAVGKKIPILSFHDLENKEITVGKARLTVVSFWNTNCSPCILELDELNKIANQRKDIDIVAITMDSTTTVKRLMYRRKQDWRRIKVVTAYKGAYDDVFDIRAWPTTFVVDNNQVIKKVFIGKSEELLNFIRNE